MSDSATLSQLPNPNVIRDAFETFSGFEHEKRAMQRWLDILRLLKHAEPPTPNLCKRVMADGMLMTKLNSQDVTVFEKHAVDMVSQAPSSLSSSATFYGWHDVVSACLILKQVFSDPYFKKQVDSVLDANCKIEPSKQKWMQVQTMLEDSDGVQTFALKTFLEQVENNQPRKAIVTLRALSYPPFVETKEEKEAREARRDLLSVKEDLEF